MTTYTSHGLPKYDTTDLIADAATNLRTNLNAISTTANTALSGVEARANEYADAAAADVNPYRGRALIAGQTADDVTTSGIYAVYTSTDAATLGLPPFPGILRVFGYDGVIEQRFDVAAIDGSWSYTRKRPRGEAWGPWIGTDTQRRNITGNLINGWTASEVTIRRVRSRITVAFIYLDYTDATSDDFLALPSGFRAYSVRVPAVLGDSVGIASVTSTGELSIPRLGKVRNARTTELSFEVDPAEPWPLNLPGTSA